MIVQYKKQLQRQLSPRSERPRPASPSVNLQHAHVQTLSVLFNILLTSWSGSVVEWLACWTQAQNVLGSDRSRDAVACRVTVLDKLFTPIVPLFTKQQNW